MRKWTLALILPLLLLSACGRDRYELVAAGEHAYRLDKKTGEIYFLDAMYAYPVILLETPKPPPTPK